MKSYITILFSRIKPRPQEILWIGVIVVIFFTISLLVNYFRSEPLTILDSKIRLGQAKTKNRNTTSHWIFCDSDAVESLIKKGSVLILDARPSLFYKMGHIPSSLSLPAGTKDLSDETRKMLAGMPVNHTIVVYCMDKDCENAETVAEQISLVCHNPIQIFAGGWEEWINKGKQIEK